jgi:hypothetical protein
VLSVLIFDLKESGDLAAVVVAAVNRFPGLTGAATRSQPPRGEGAGRKGPVDSGPRFGAGSRAFASMSDEHVNMST